MTISVQSYKRLRFAVAILGFASAALLLTVWIFDGNPPIGLVLLVCGIGSFVGLAGPKLKAKSVGPNDR